MAGKTRIFLALGSAATAATYLGYTGNEWFYKHVLMKCVQRVDAEKAHVMGVKLASMGLLPKGTETAADRSLLETKVFGLQFQNPIGLAAGFDKDAECYNGMLHVGFGFVEVGSVTPQPQEGNAKPRVFRLTEDKAIINRYGFNSDGIRSVKKRLQERTEGRTAGIVGVNIGRNKTTEDPVEDFVLGIKELGDWADYVVINVSSPNTPGLRKMQGKEQLRNLIQKVLEAKIHLKNRPPLLLKIAPDLTEDDKRDIVDVVMNDETKVDGLIVSNTTLSRPRSLENISKDETGGLSGEPLRDMATKAVGDIYNLTKGRLPIIGVGGVSSGQDAYEKICAGASLVQLYTALAYEGPPIVSKIKRELATLLRRDGFGSVAEAVGSAHRKEVELNQEKENE